MDQNIDEFLIVSKRISKYAANAISDSSEVKQYMQALNADGSWPDINYELKEVGMWECVIHLNRLKSMSTVYANESFELFHNQNLKSSIIKALTFWAENDFVNRNWWYNDIGKQQFLRDIAINMGDELDEWLINYILNTLQGTLENISDEILTGANKVWIAENILYKGILTRDIQLVRYAANAIGETVKIAKITAETEGIQPDFSFTQHNLQLYSYGYGSAFIGRTVFWFYMLRNTKMSFGRDCIDLLTLLILNGNRWMFRFASKDFSTEGREITRHHSKYHTDMRGFIDVLEKLADVQTETQKKQDLLNMACHIKGLRKDPGITGNKMFWRVDYMTHVRQNYYASLRMLSKGVVGCEYVNCENVLAGFVSYGLTNIMVHAGEYFKIFPLWNWALLPGVTCPMVELPTKFGSNMDNEFVGGVSNGTYGAAAIDIYKEYCMDKNEGNINFSAKKSYFFFNKEIVMLGCDISANAPQPVSTSLNQCNLRGDVYVDGVIAPKSSSARKVSGDYVYHDNIGYVFLDKQEFMLKNGEQTGSWRRISTGHDVPESEVKGDVFALYIDHGIKPDKCSYEYIVLPGAEIDEVKDYCNNKQTQILSNTNMLQAVHHKNLGITSAIFYKKGDIKIGPKKLSVSQPCMLIYEEKAGGHAQLSISNPETVGLQITVRIDNGQKSDIYTVSLPDDEMELGKSVSIKIGQ